MMRMTFFLITLLWFASPSATANDSPVAEQYEALLSEFKEEGVARSFSKRFLQLAEQHPEDQAAADALLWVVSNVRGKSDTTRALEMLAEHHLDSEKLGPAGQVIVTSRSIAAEKLLRGILEKNPHKKVRAQACFYLASLLDLHASLVQQLKARPNLAPRVRQYYGKDYGEHLISLRPAALDEQRVHVYQQLLDRFPDVEMQDGTMGEIAERMLFRIRHLEVGKVAPEIEGEDIHGKQFKLSDYRGKIVMLTFWGHW